jgi:hypothetical protein
LCYLSGASQPTFRKLARARFALMQIGTTSRAIVTRISRHM